MKLSAFLDELIEVEAARMAHLHELRARLTSENEEQAAESDETAAVVQMMPRTTRPAGANAINHYRCQCGLPARRVPASGWKEGKNGKLWAAFACPKEKDDQTACKYWEFDPAAPPGDAPPVPAQDESYKYVKGDDIPF